MRLPEKRVSYHVIEAASLGNAEAIQEILNHYDGYIKKLSVGKMIDEWDTEKHVMDTYLYEILRVHHHRAAAHRNEAKG